jgi:PIN like domain
LKRRSATKPSRSQPEPTFFTDRDLGKLVPRLLRESGLLVERYSDHFQESNVTDQEWLAFAAQRGWVALSHDKNIRRDPVAVDTIMTEGGRLFIIRGVLTGAEKAEIVLDALGSVRRLIGEHQDEAFIGVIRRAVVKAGMVHPEAKIVLTARQWSTRNRRGATKLPDEEDDV